MKFMTDKMYAFLFGCSGTAAFTNGLYLLMENKIWYGVILLAVSVISLGVGAYISFRKDESK